MHSVHRLASVVVLALAVFVPIAPATPAAPTGQLYLIQGVPGERMEIALDDRLIRSDAASGAVLGPLRVAAGSHTVLFTDSTGAAITATVDVVRGASRDVVLHRPAAVGGAPVAHVYASPEGPIGPDKARVLVAHTATVPPADVVVDGTPVFTNIANGEFADADVPAGPHQVEVVPTGTSGPAVLGPLEVDLPARTLTMVYAVGNPSNGSMTVIARSSPLAADGSVVPRRIETGSAGCAAQVVVRTSGAALLRSPGG